MSTLRNKIILVTGATGQQGGATARSLLKRGWEVRALVRDMNKPTAIELQKLGASLHGGNFDDPSSISRAMDGAYGVYSVQNFFEVGFEKEIQQGCLIADIAKELKVQHLVYGSVIGADRNSHIPHFDTKWKIEEYIRKIGQPSTMLRPVAYMDNFLNGFWYSDGKLVVPMRKESKWQVIAIKDMGEFAAIAFEKPDEFLGKALEIAGDEFTMPQAAQAFREVFGRAVEFVELPVDSMRKMNEELALMFEWFNDKANFADLKQLKTINPDLWTLEKWLKKSDFVNSASKEKR